MRQGIERVSPSTLRPTVRSRRQAVERLIEIAILSPTSFNLQQWRFVIIDEEPQLNVLLGNERRDCAQLLIFVLSRVSEWQRVESFTQHLSEELKARAHRNCHAVYSAHPAVQRDEAFRSGGLVAAAIMELFTHHTAHCALVDRASIQNLEAVMGSDPDRVITNVIAVRNFDATSDESCI